MSTIWTIIKKELRRFFTDPRMLISMFLPGILIFCIYSIMGGIMKDVTNPTFDTFNVVVENQPEELEYLLKSNKDWKVTFEDPSKTTEQQKMEALENKKLDLYVVFEEDFMNKIMAYQPGENKKAPYVYIYFNSTNEVSSYIYNYYFTALDAVESQLSNKFDVNINPDIDFDVADEGNVTAYIISKMIPFLLITFLFSGCMAICPESIAGEKERGTIATLLITPVKRTHIALGKIISLGITGLASSLVSFLGLMLSLPKLMGTSFDFSIYGVKAIVLILLLIIVSVLLFTTMITIVSTLAKSTKEANSYISPLMILVMLVGITNFMTNVTASNPLLYMIPIFNIMQCFIGIFSLNIDTLNLTICIISNAVYIAIGVYALAKMFNNERIMFNK